MSSFQPNSLADGYSLRLATKTDLLNLLEFEYFSHEPSAGKRTIIMLLICVLLCIAYLCFFLLYTGA